MKGNLTTFNHFIIEYLGLSKDTTNSGQKKNHTQAEPVVNA